MRKRNTVLLGQNSPYNQLLETERGSLFGEREKDFMLGDWGLDREVQGMEVRMIGHVDDEIFFTLLFCSMDENFR
jgi:hypothetical protein